MAWFFIFHGLAYIRNKQIHLIHLFLLFFDYVGQHGFYLINLFRIFRDFD